MRSTLAAQATKVSVVSQGRQTSIFGIKRKVEVCSTG